MQPMVAKAERAGGWASRMGERSRAWWIRCLAVASLVLVAVAIVLEISRMGRLIAAWPAETAAITMLGLAGLAAASQPQGNNGARGSPRDVELGARLAPEAQLIVAADGRIHYANRAFRELFPGPAQSPLDRVRQALCSDAESEAQFRRLRGRAAAGVPATATSP